MSILALHGFTQNGTKLYFLLNDLGIQAICPNGPNLLSSGKFGWWYTNEDNPMEIDWTNNTVTKIGLQKSLDLLSDLIKEYKPKCIIGFSQGGALLDHACSLGIVPVDVTVIFCATFSFDDSMITRRHKSVHIMSRRDTIIPEKESVILAEKYHEGKIVKHKGGHKFPKNLKDLLS